MKTLTIVLFLSYCSTLLAPEAAAQSDPNGWGPGEPGECVMLEEGDVRFETGSLRVVGNSVYKTEWRSDCSIKIIDLPFTLHGLDFEPFGFLHFWSDQGAYRCKINGDSLEQIDAYGFLSGFLFHPIERASASEGQFGCFGGDVEVVDHDIVDVGDAVPSLLHEVRPTEERSKGGGEINGIDLDELKWALRSVNMDPWHAPSITEFEIDDRDLQAYAERVALDLKSLSPTPTGWEYFTDPTLENRDIFLDLPSLLDTLSPEVIRTALIYHRTGNIYSGHSSYEVTLVNSVEDTLHCSFTSNGPNQPFCLPWTIRYGDSEFQSYSVELARLLMGLLPEDEDRTEREQKVDLLYAIAAYLGEVRSRRE